MGFRDDLGMRIATSNGAGLVALLYEGLIENMKEIMSNMNDKETIVERLDNSRDILSHLMATLGEDDELTLNTKNIYLYVNRLMTEGYNNNSIQKYEEVIKVITPLWEAWNELSLTDTSKTVEAPKPSVVAGMTYGRNNMSEYVTGNVKDWDKG